MGLLERVFGLRGFSVSVDEAGSTFLYRERGRRMHVSGEAMADGYALYWSSIKQWEGGKKNTAVTVDEAERQRIASNIRRYFVARGKSVYLA